MKKMILLVITVVVAFSAFVIANQENITIVYDYINIISLNETGRVQLKNNAGAGYEWHWTATNPSVIQLNNSKNQVKGVEGLVGEAYNVIWDFTPIEAGETALIFKYYRSWEGEDSAIETRVFNITISSDVILGNITENIVFLKDIINELSIDNLAGIILEENASTGYIWQYGISNPELLSLESKIVLTKNNELITGASSDIIWKFNVLNAGNCLLTFNKIRPWEDEGSAIETRYFNIVIRDSRSPVVKTDDVKKLKDIVNHAAVNDLCEIILEENGSTGFTWHYTLTNPDILELVSKKTIQNEDSDMISGAPYKVIFEFKALKTGTTTVTLRNYRTWEGEESADEIRVYNIVVE